MGTGEPGSLLQAAPSCPGLLSEPARDLRLRPAARERMVDATSEGEGGPIAAARLGESRRAVKPAKGLHTGTS